MRSLVALLLWLVLSVGANAKDTGYVFVSHERTNNIAVIDPKQDYRISEPASNRHKTTFSAGEDLSF